MLNGTLGKYTGSNYTIELKDDTKHYHAKPFPIPKIHELTLKKEVNRLIKIGVLKNINISHWATPRGKFFQFLNKQDLLLKLEALRYATSFITLHYVLLLGNYSQ